MTLSEGANVLIKRKLGACLAGAVLLAAFTLTGCGGSGDGAAQDNQPADSEEMIHIVFCHNQPVGSPEDIGAQAMVEKLYDKLGDRVSIELYPAQQMYDMDTQIEKLQLGEIQLTMQPTAAVASVVDDIKVMDLPYLMPADETQIFDVLDGALGQEALDRLEQGNLKGLGFWYSGYKLFTTSGKEIHSPADFQGMTMRVLNSPVLKAQYENWGAQPVPTTYTELYGALQNGTVEGQENPVQTIVLNNYQDVQSQMVQAWHSPMHYVLMTNPDWFHSLPANVQEAIAEAEAYGREKAREAYAEQEAGYIEILENAEGVHYYELTPEEIDVFKAGVQPVYQSQTAGSQWQIDYVKRLQEAFAEE